MGGNRILKLIAEGLLIIFSILLAFAIEAYWEERKERIEEKKLLINLEKDFKRNKKLLDIAISRFNGTMKNTTALMEFIRPNDPKRNLNVPDSLLFNIVLWHTYDPVVGTLNSAISSGRISLIENEELRSELAIWQDLVKDMKESEEVDYEILVRIYNETFHYIPLRTMAFNSGYTSMKRKSTAKTDYQRLTNSIYLENLLTNRLGEMGITLGETVLVSQSLDNVLNHLEKELRSQ